MLFETARFVVKPLVASDAAEHLCDWTLDPLAAEMLNTPQRIWTIESQRTYFSSHEHRKDKHLLGIWAKDEAKLIGLYVISPHPGNQTFTLSTLIGDKAWRGKGTATEATDALYAYYFDQLGYAKAKANVRPQNKAMLWLMLSGAWKKEAHLEKHLFDEEQGKRVDVYVLGLLAEDWRAERKANSGRNTASIEKAKQVQS